MKTEQTTLSNGLKTLFIDSPGANSASVQIWFKAGSSLESKSDFGIAHFLEHMFFKGSKKYPNMQLAKKVESFGGEVNAFTSFDYTCYYINSPKKNILESCDLLLDMVCNPLFKEQDFPAEKNVVHEEYRRSVDSPSQYNFFQIQKNIFAGDYSHPILGTEKHILNFNKKQLMNFRDKFYNLNNAMFVVAGDLSKKDQIVKKANLFKLPVGSKSSFSKFKLKNTSNVNIHHKATNQTTLNFIIQAPNYEQRESAIEDLALNCLTYGDISPLSLDLVTNSSIATTVSGSTLFFANNGCHFLKSTLPFENLDKFCTEFLKSLKDIFKKGFTIDQIDRIRNQYIASKIYEKETIESFAFSLGHGFAQTENINCEDDFINNMKNASISDVHKALLNIFANYIHVNVQLPEDKKAPKLAARLEKLRVDIQKLAKQELSKLDNFKFQTSKYDSSTKLIEIKKNIKVIHRENKMTPTFAFHIYLKGGLSYESEANNGVYNLISKNLTYGHKKAGYQELKTYLEQSSSYLNGFSGKNAYGLTLHGLSENFNSLIEHFFLTLFEPKIPQSFLKLEKEMIKRSIFIQKQDPLKHCFKTFNRYVFNGHPYSYDLMGNEKSIKNISRKTLIDTHQKSIETSELVFCYSGDKSFESVMEVIEPYLVKLKARANQKKPKHQLKPLKKQNKKIEFDREQTHIVIGKPAFKNATQNDLYLKMFTTLLAGQSSELFMKVRDEMGLCYSCQPLHLTAVEAGYWAIYIGAGHDKKDEAIKAIKDILNKYRTKGISKSDFARIKKMILGQNQINIQTNDDYASYYSIPVLHNLGIDFQNETLEKLQNIKREEVNNFLSKFLVDDWNIVEVGPK